MSEYIVSARKYRPTTFKTVVGQEIITTTLKNSIKKKQLSHAYLFCGPRGVGKTTCARILAKTINCFNPTPDQEPCNQCESCINFNKNALFNIHELDAASNNSVEAIRELINQVRIPPQLGKYSVFIIDEVHMLSKDAFNAFLKTLEEPPMHAIFILATTEKHKIIPTILSRCQVFDFKRIQINDIVNHLEYIAQQENIKAEREALQIIAQKADGSMRDALSIFDQMASFTENNITYDSVIKILNVLDYEYYFKMTDLFLKGDTSESLLLFNEILYNGFDPQYFISGLAEHIRNLMLCKDTKTTALLEVSDNVAKKYELQAKQCTVNFLYQALNIINETDVQYKTSYNKRFLVELMLYKLCYINQQTPIKNTDDKVKVANNVTQEKKNDNLTNVTNEPEPIKYNKEEPVLNKEVKKKEINQQKLLPSGLSIKENVIASEKADNKTKIEQIGTEPFTKQQAEKIWKNYVNLHLTDIRLKNIYLSNNDLAQWEETTLKLYVLNKSQEQIIKKLYDEMLHFFKVNLNNRNVKIEIILKDDEVKLNTPYTDKEKYDYFEKKYPLLNVIKNELNLDFM